ncbi:response regulator [Roseococcus sp. YIM B11640]|uniref:response regulator n=1 Tax=Roseococcus sp. YIM B11640 TaxID=3133973 RepID=UPI003C79A758
MTATDTTDGGSRRPGEKTILFVEDELIISMVGSAMIADLGYTVLQASSGAEALRLLDERPVDLLITDLSMPGMDGAELARIARDRQPGLPVLVATGYSELPSGLDANLSFLRKPYEKSRLQAAIQKALDAPG